MSNDITTKKIASRLKAAFNNAVFLGHAATRDAVIEALDQVDPLTVMERKAAFFMLTARELSVRNHGPELKARIATNERDLRENLAEAHKLAQGAPKLAAAVLKAQQSLPKT